MKLTLIKLLFLVMTVGNGVCLADPPGDGKLGPTGRWEGDISPPSVSRKATWARMFPTSLEPSACDTGWLVTLRRMTALLPRYQIILHEITRGDCPRMQEWDRKHAKDVIFDHVEMTPEDDGSIVYRNLEKGRVVILSDKRGSTLEPKPAWVAIIQEEFFSILRGVQASSVESGEFSDRPTH